MPKSSSPSKEKNGAGKGKKEKEKEDEMPEEDKALKEGLELAVMRLSESNSLLHKQALDHLEAEIKSATSSMTSVPKPLKYLRPHYDTLKTIYQSWPAQHSMKQMMADVMSVLAMTMQPVGSRECLKFKLQGTNVNISSWGHEYVRSLSGEVSEEYNLRSMESPAEDDADVDDLMELVDDMIPFQMQHNAEAEAVDLLIEVQQLKKLVESPVVDARNYERVCLYLLRCADFVSDPDDLYNLFTTAYTIYKTQKKYPNALRVALKMDDMNTEKIDELFSEELAVPDLVRKQMAFILARQRSTFSTNNDEAVNEIISNTNLSERFISVGRDMDLVEPKDCEDIFKTKNESGGLARLQARNNVADSARMNIASSIVNAFINAGFGTDKLMTDATSNWVFRNKDHGQLTASASLGLVMLWNVDEGLNKIDKFLHIADDNVKAGACLAIGIVASGVRNDSDPALALLRDYIESSTSSLLRISSICGLAIAYAGAKNEEISELLIPIVSNTEDANIVEVSFAALALGMVFVGSCNDEVGSVLAQRLMESSDEELNHTLSRYLCLGLGLLYLGKQERAEAMLEIVRTVEHKRGKYAEITLLSCAHAGSGNVLKVQSMLHTLSEHLTEDADHQAVAVLGLGLISAGEDIATEMTLRTFEHLLHYGELPVKRVVPLALAVLYISNPDYAIIDQLSRLSHDQDADIAQCAILGLGLVSAGSCNSRVAGLFRQLSEFYAKDASHLFVVKLAQGLNHLGKGLMSLNPFTSDRLLMNGPAMAGLLPLLHACFDLKGTILDKYHYILFFLTTAMNPRFMTTVDENLSPISISVRVGMAVETVGQAGRPKTISGFQTHTTPVLLGYRDRAEFAGGDYEPATSIIEGVVIVEKKKDEEMQVV